MLKGEEVTQETSGMSKGEWREFEGVIGWILIVQISWFRQRKLALAYLNAFLLFRTALKTRMLLTWWYETTRDTLEAIYASGAGSYFANNGRILTRFMLEDLGS